MKMTFRWYADKDSITLSQIKQIPNVSGVVTAVYDVPVGEIWDLNRILTLKKKINESGLSMEVIESVPVHEDIKLGLPSRELYVQNYKKNIENLAKAGVKCICYNFMPVFDWLRTDLKRVAVDGSNSLSYNHDEILKLDVHNLSLPGWDESYSKFELNGLLNDYKNMSKQQLLENLIWFLKNIIPTCEEYDVKMAIHPDDPPWNVFGLPRTVSSSKDLDEIFSAVPSIYNGLTFCTGSLGAGKFNELVSMANKYANQNRIHFAHLRNIAYTDKGFYETAHPTECGDLDMFAIVKTLVKNKFNGYVRPDHGRNIWGENKKPGYGLYDRALGACYLNGLFEGIEKSMVK